MQTNNVSKPSWNITNGAIEPNRTLAALLVQQRLLNENLLPVKTGLVGAILAREFVSNPELSLFKVEIYLKFGTTYRLTVEKSLNLMGQEAPFDFQLEMTDDDEIEVLFKAFEKNHFGVVEIECRRDDIASLLGSGEWISGNEAFENFFPGLAGASAQPH